MTKPGGKLKGAAIVLILVVGLIHLIDVPGSFTDATYKGILFLANAAGAIVAAIGINKNVWSYGWILGLIVAAGSLVAYVVSRTVGLPGFPPDDWFEELGILSLVVEAAFIGVFVKASSDRTADNARLKTKN